MTQNRLKLIGLTGNSGSGKSLVAEILRRHTSYIIDADVIARDVVKPGQRAYDEIVNHFGRGILQEDGTLNRRALGDLVFRDEAERRILIDITHKYIKEEIFRQIELANENEKEYGRVVIDAPLLVEAGLHKEVDSVWLVYADYEIRLQRIMCRDSIGREQAEARLRSQMDYERLKKYADVILLNNGDDPRLLEEQVLCFMYSI